MLAPPCCSTSKIAPGASASAVVGLATHAFNTSTRMGSSTSLIAAKSYGPQSISTPPPLIALFRNQQLLGCGGGRKPTEAGAAAAEQPIVLACHTQHLARLRQIERQWLLA